MGILVILIICVGLVAGVLGLVNGSIHFQTLWLVLGLLGAGVLLVLGGLLSRNHSQDRDINGEIETELQSFCDRRTRMIYLAMAGKATQADIDAITAEERAFRDTIEYGRVTDGSENYYSYKAGHKP